MKNQMSALRSDAARRSRIKDVDLRGKKMNATEAAEYLGIKRGTIINWTAAKEVPAYKCFGNLVFFEKELKGFLDLMTMPI